MLLREGALRAAYSLSGAVPDFQLFHLLPGELYVELPGGGVGEEVEGSDLYLIGSGRLFVLLERPVILKKSPFV
ncbi:hypothetical protein [Phaeodactylibacter xiamenensis]|uniref:hypothetical protein n=1 Tax=Phaeodactylibacter xiamenensis TaxID=1524460 RepID=UPI0024A9254C|nr:hypothetical protein [Phaeodactylibacter xiamenensis]